MDIILLKVKENPVLYLGKPSLELLRAFINGYLICKGQINGRNSCEFYPGFQEFILQKHHIEIPTSYHWSEVIRFNTFTDEQAFYEFFDLLDELKVNQNHKTSDFITDLCLGREKAMDIIDEIFIKIKERPGLYLGALSLELLNVFINGCLACINQINGDDSFEFYSGFQDFVVQKYDIKIAAHWSKIINFVTVSDKKALYRFFELLDEFKANKNDKGGNPIDIILLKVRETPVLYLGKPSLKLLHAFISGYLICRDIINGINSDEFYPGLEAFILQKYHIKTPTTHHCFSVIRFNTFNERQAFYEFFELLNEFKASQEYNTSDVITDLCLSEEEAMNIIDEKILKIKERPELYIGIPSLELLNVFINGCLAYINQINGKRDGSFEFYRGFQEFVVQKYNIKIEAHWSKIINFVTTSDKEAFYKFFELLDDFKAKQKILIDNL